MGLAVLASCTSFDYPDRFKPTKGLPAVHYVRYADRDIIIDQASMEETICIVGDNLTSVHDIYFNDQPAVLNTSFITEHALIVSVPKNLPTVQDDKMHLITRDSSVVLYDFKVLPPLPKISAMSNEWANPGETVTVMGSYLFAPLTVQFPGVDPVDITASTGDAFDVVIPAGAQPGKIKVTTASGTAQSIFMFQDSRGMLFNFDTDPHPGNHGWHAMVIETDATALSGNFLRLGGGGATLDEDGGWNDGAYSFEYWPGDWDDPVTYADSPRLTDFVDFSDWENMSFKFELYIPSANPWMSGSMQIICAGVDKVTDGATGATDIYGNTLAGANNTFFNGNTLPRGLYTPWASTGSFDTGDKWITVTIPLTQFNKGWNGQTATKEVNAASFASMWFFICDGGLEFDDASCTPIIKIDNVRAVPIK